ncbi:MAG: S1/P1 nuclease [Bacteroidia bacterium]|nr:S1/P1 nuclease [Bacteroidia bacterium]
MKRIIILFVTSLVFFPGPMFSWGPQGHRLVMQIARSQLDQSVVETVNYYLKGTTWEEAALWMDEVQSDPKMEYMKTWHYINIPKDKTYVPSKDPDVVNKLEYCLRMIQYRTYQSPEIIAETLKILFHLIADIHQPLHCGYAEDHGGNDIRLYMIQKETNLHKVWDSELVSEKRMDMWYCAKVLVSMKITDKKRAEMEKVNVVGWLNESRALLPEVYKFTGNRLDQKYVDANIKVVEFQLVKAGFRLAAILNQYFK